MTTTVPMERLLCSTATASHRQPTHWISTSHVYPAHRTTSSPAACHAVQRIVPVRPDVGLRATPSQHTNTLQRGTTLLLIVRQGEGETVDPFLKAVIRKAEANLIERRANEEVTQLDEVWLVHSTDGLDEVQLFLRSYLPLPSTPVELQAYGPRWPPIMLRSQRAGCRGRTIVCVTRGAAPLRATALSSALEWHNPVCVPDGTAQKLDVVLTAEAWTHIVRPSASSAVFTKDKHLVVECMRSQPFDVTRLGTRIADILQRRMAWMPTLTVKEDQPYVRLHAHL